ncbi:hypothetical protein [Candidatus Spongiihabitans sp.]
MRDGKTAIAVGQGQRLSPLGVSLDYRVKPDNDGPLLSGGEADARLCRA